ncbi:hypothetical protein SAMN00120144_4284 [Hymenobacter roseosalivarius DSM 11622]|uniref:Uncharacterized protein n=1 Tax=Hymenobacter roseosalivarius DSM 11622 TaxID=645990 RepID=A0A1W1VXU8_9BACT|nr:hypothetical protein SAMN00120144_4284 [Hymenobacter roseosalivarius DSM 11622]
MRCDLYNVLYGFIQTLLQYEFCKIPVCILLKVFMVFLTIYTKKMTSKNF